MIRNAMTVDVEDYFHVAAFSDAISRGSWASQPLRVEANTHRLLDIFDSHNIQATFFMLGWVAEKLPQLTREIASRHHEVACHGYSHQLIYTQTPDEFYAETKKAKSIIEDQIQARVTGYRAASYSITLKSLWALDTLADLEFEYDSSIFPVRHDRYGIPGSARFPYIIETPRGKQLIEYPISTYAPAGFSIPVAGGGYFRLFPYWFTAAALKAINVSEKKPFIFYLHPWEIDPNQPRVKNAKWFSKFRHYNNLDTTETRLEKLLTNFEFGRVRDVLSECGLM